MIAADLGRLETVVALLEHFEKRKKGPKNNAKDQSDGSDMEDADEYGEEEPQFDVDYINFKDRSSRTAL